MKQKLFVLSVDAMVHEDVEYMMTKPNFSSLMANRAEVEHVRSVYPTSTYPAHTTIMTGVNPGKHGIFTNMPMKTVQDGIPHWYLYSDSVWAEDIFTVAKRAGATTAAVYWPITGKHPDIDHIIDEYFFYYPNEDIVDTFIRLGAGPGAVKAIRENLHRFPSDRGARKMSVRSTFDDFLMGCTCSLIRNEKPDLLLVHNCYLDSYRHGNGVFGSAIKDCLDMIDVWIGEVMDTMKEAGVYEETNFVILSDHGQMDFTRRVKLNVLLKRGGFLEEAPDGSLYHWNALAQSNGLSATIYLHDNTNEALKEKVYAYLMSLAEEGCYGFTKVYTASEVREKYGNYGPFCFMVESDGSTTFSDDWKDPLESPVDVNDYRLGNATHGYEPEKGPQPVFLGTGPAFRENVVIKDAALIDEAPTFAAILGQEMKDTDGRCLKELLK